MEKLEIDFRKLIWKQRNLINLGELDHVTSNEEIWQWDDYVLQHWDFKEDVEAENYK